MQYYYCNVRLYCNDSTAPYAIHHVELREDLWPQKAGGMSEGGESPHIHSAPFSVILKTQFLRMLCSRLWQLLGHRSMIKSAKMDNNT